MRRLMLLATSAFVALLVLAPAAVAQEKMEMKMEEEKKVEMEEKGKEKMKSMPKTGGPEVGMLLLPASALLLCSGILGYAILRRR